MSDEILIGEGVVLDARPASFASRMLGAALDVLVLLAVGFGLFALGATVGSRLDDAAGAALAIAILVLVLVGIPTAVETLTRGRSLGKLAAGLRIVRDDGGPVRFRHALVRALVGVGEMWFTAGAVALVTSIVHPQGKRLGDVVAGTYAVRVRGAQSALPPLVMPPELAAWAHGADIRRLPDGVALAARQFLGRTARLNPGSRMRLGIELAAQIERYVAPGPPPGTHPERFIAAVLCERRDREYAQALRRRQRALEEAALVHRLPHAVPDPVD